MFNKILIMAMKTVITKPQLFLSERIISTVKPL